MDPGLFPVALHRGVLATSGTLSTRNFFRVPPEHSRFGAGSLPPSLRLTILQRMIRQGVDPLFLSVNGKRPLDHSDFLPRTLARLCQ